MKSIFPAETQRDEAATKIFHRRAPAPAMPGLIEIGNLTTKGTKGTQRIRHNPAVFNAPIFCFRRGRKISDIENSGLITIPVFPWCSFVTFVVKFPIST
jgi:hypothetical protein